MLVLAKMRLLFVCVSLNLSACAAYDNIKSAIDDTKKANEQTFDLIWSSDKELVVFASHKSASYGMLRDLSLFAAAEHMQAAGYNLYYISSEENHSIANVYYTDDEQGWPATHPPQLESDSALTVETDSVYGSLDADVVTWRRAALKTVFRALPSDESTLADIGKTQVYSVDSVLKDLNPQFGRYFEDLIFTDYGNALNMIDDQ